MKIGKREVEASYKLAVEVWNGTTTEAEARNKLHTELGMNSGSASDLIRNFSQMMRGETYHRTLNHETTRYYFENIWSDFGEQYLALAIQATKNHLKYYMHLATGSAQPGLRKICEQFESSLTRNFEVDADFEFADGFQEAVRRSALDTQAARRERLRIADPTAKPMIVKTVVYRRNPDVVAERLLIARGVCEFCKSPAPFSRENGEPFLEVHHVIPLSEDGRDEVENTIALCPNCHREAHFGEERMKYRN